MGGVATPCPERWHHRPLQAASNSFSTITSGAVSTACEPWAKGITWTSLWVSSQRGHGCEASPAPSALQDGTPHPGMFAHRAQPACLCQCGWLALSLWFSLTQHGLLGRTPALWPFMQPQTETFRAKTSAGVSGTDMVCGCLHVTSVWVLSGRATPAMPVLMPGSVCRD